MNWFKAILLLSVLGMTWVECDRPSAVHTHFWPETRLEPAATNALAMPVSARGKS